MKIKNQRGISLFEVLCSLGIIAIILVMAAKYFFVANRNDKVNVVRQQIGAVVSAIESWKAEHATYSATPSLTVGTLSEQGFLANSSLLVNAGTANATLNNPWGYSIRITNVSDNGVDIQTTLPSINECRALRNSYPDAQNCTSGQFTLHT
ncbi:MAG: type II secretion system protein, partial [Coxiellaceae bacterium]|nr:type II secretion system protein [Coxiellaceae bacterium]